MKTITHISKWRVKLACILLDVNEYQLNWAFHILETAPQYNASEEDQGN
jgi:hypothetical protein